MTREPKWPRNAKRCIRERAPKTPAANLCADPTTPRDTDRAAAAQEFIAQGLAANANRRDLRPFVRPGANHAPDKHRMCTLTWPYNLRRGPRIERAR